MRFWGCQFCMHTTAASYNVLQGDLIFLYDLEMSGSMSRRERWVGARHLYLNFDDPRLLVLISGYPRFLTSFFCMTFRCQGQGHGGNDLGWVGASHLYLNFDDPHLLILISGYYRFSTSFFCMTLISQTQGHGGNNFGWVGARHLYLNFDDPRLFLTL